MGAEETSQAGNLASAERSVERPRRATKQFFEGFSPFLRARYASIEFAQEGSVLTGELSFDLADLLVVPMAHA